MCVYKLLYKYVWSDSQTVIGNWSIENVIYKNSDMIRKNHFFEKTYSKQLRTNGDVPPRNIIF